MSQIPRRPYPPRKAAPHTPAPFHAEQWNDIRINVVAANGVLVASCGAKMPEVDYPAACFIDEAWANADLFVAAPAMLAALKALRLECLADPLNPCWDNRPTDKPGLHWGSEPDNPVAACSSCVARAAIAKAEGRATPHNNPSHSQDSDCDIDPDTGCCRQCGTEHREPCPDCGATGFHKPTCWLTRKDR